MSLNLCIDFDSFPSFDVLNNMSYRSTLLAYDSLTNDHMEIIKC